jgi:cytochrome P450
MQPFIKELIPLYLSSNDQSDLLYAYPMLVALYRYRLSKFGPTFEKLLLPIIKERRKEQNTQRHDILQVFLDYEDSETGQTLSDREILSEVFSLLQAAGSVATSMADIVNRMVVDEGRPFLQKIEDEQRSVSKEYGPEFNATTLSKMTYYDAAIRETLRLEFTLTSWRRANIDIQFHDGLVIPKGFLALMTMVGVNLNEELFPDVKKWSPDRYVADDSQKAPSPFIWGAGLHPCAGRKHAQLGMKLPPLMMLRQFHLRTSESGSLLHVKKRLAF